MSGPGNSDDAASVFHVETTDHAHTEKENRRCGFPMVSRFVNLQLHQSNSCHNLTPTIPTAIAVLTCTNNALATLTAVAMLTMM